MKKSKECKVVQDLLPNYIEKLTSKETNDYIEEHINECQECSKILDNMKKEIKVDNKTINKKEVKYIKKYNSKLKILKSILLIILLIYVIVIGRRAIIMTSLSAKARQYLEKDNYHVKLYSYQGDTLVVTDSYQRSGDYLTIREWQNTKANRKMILYKKGNDLLALTEFSGHKNKYDPNTIVGGDIYPVTYVSDGFLSSLQYAFFIGLDSTYCNGKECYVIKGKNYESYVDRETGLAVRRIEKTRKESEVKNDMVVDYEYEFDVVDDDDIVKPDETGYVLKE